LRVQGIRSRSIDIDDAQEAVGVDLILELAQEPVKGSHQAVGPVRAQVPP